jgi:5'-nucleotidase
MDDKRPLFLLTNDDGFYAEGIQILFERLRDLGADVYVVAPDREQSATSMALTLHHPLRVKTIKDRVYAVDGTPTDCVYLAVRKLLPRIPDLLISGINRGPNLGQQDISYSGTVGGAVQGTFLQIPSLAVSHLPDRDGTCYFGFCSEVVNSLSTNLLKRPLPEGITLNINIPPPPVKGLRLAKLGQKHYHPEIIVRTDPRERDYYWIGTGVPQAMGDSESDVKLILDGYITMTPLHRDLTAYSQFEAGTWDDVLDKVNREIVP